MLTPAAPATYCSSPVPMGTVVPSAPTMYPRYARHPMEMTMNSNRINVCVRLVWHPPGVYSNA